MLELRLSLLAGRFEGMPRRCGRRRRCLHTRIRRVPGFSKGVERQGMEYSDYSYSAATQAEFFRAEAELIRLGDRLVHSPTAKYMKSTLLAIDAVFAIRMSHDVDLPAVSLITAFDLIGWKYHGDVRRSVRARLPEFEFPDGSHEAAVEALHYMQTMDLGGRERATRYRGDARRGPPPSRHADQRQH